MNMIPGPKHWSTIKRLIWLKAVLKQKEKQQTEEEEKKISDDMGGSDDDKRGTQQTS